MHSQSRLSPSSQTGEPFPTFTEHPITVDARGEPIAQRRLQHLDEHRALVHPRVAGDDTLRAVPDGGEFLVLVISEVPGKNAGRVLRLAARSGAAR